ncbi:putative pentatricopeptide repeat-containing protein At3g01580 [Impatiens glandulifera]|uniref:putative pentatricopeptide repeat-containing protein At3g01580 n=1 Tax=Impatiens glandulifera TaxID=253017 RepID=UPI001FB17B4F|nr:putative pentatricopeptide repeat-containing protein At3g01580 [Impatiens glandulifera]
MTSSFLHTTCSMECLSETFHVLNSKLRRYYADKQYRETLHLFSHLFSIKKSDISTIPITLKACTKLYELKFGRIIHGFMIKNGSSRLNFGESALVELYSKFGSMDDAMQVYKDCCKPDVFLWTAMISGYDKKGYSEKALSIFVEKMKTGDFIPHQITLVSVVSACTKLMNKNMGRSVHGFVTRMGFDTVLSLDNSLLNFYGKIGAVEASVNLFRTMNNERDVVSWSTMISSYAHNGLSTEAIDSFNKMVYENVEPNAITLIHVLKACEDTSDLDQGKKIHEYVVRKGFESDPSVSTSLMYFYMKCGSIEIAVDVFDRMPRKDVVSWIAFLSGYVKIGMAHEGISVFKRMLRSGIKPDPIAMVKFLSASAESGNLIEACSLHDYLVKGGFEENVFVQSSLIELYSKCGELHFSMSVFERAKIKDVFLWSSMIAGYGIHGRAKEAVELFNEMITSVRPNKVTFLSILSACSHAGLVKEGIRFFEMMVNDYKLYPESAHFGILVDLVSRNGEIDKAVEIINRMPIQAGANVWGALLGACRIHGNVEIGELAIRELSRLDPDHAGYHILLSNMYFVEGKWELGASIRNAVKTKRLKKTTAQSVIGIGNEIHSFVADDNMHPFCNQIYSLLGNMWGEMNQECYVSHMNNSLVYQAEEIL